MAILNDFEYFKPKTINEAIKLLSKIKGSKILAGGTDLVGNMKEELDKPKAVIDIKGLKELTKITFNNNKLQIGALVTFTDIIESKLIAQRLPVLIEVAKYVASMGIRNRATLVGNICSAVPCMDTGPIISATEALIVTKSTLGVKKIPASKFFIGVRKTSLKSNELVTALEIPISKEKSAGAYVKLMRLKGEDLAQASVLVLVDKKKNYNVSFGSVAVKPIRAITIEKLLNGKELNEELLNEAINLIPNTIKPITDIRATKEYRMHMSKVMFERAIKTSIDRLNGKGIPYGERLI